jgi:hypothetical protein
MKINKGKLLALGVLAVSLVGCLQAYSQQIIPCFPAPSGIVAWYRAETNTIDSIGGHDASGTIGYTNGEVGYSFFYDGNINTYLSVPASSNLDIGAGSGLTIEGWIKPDHELSGTGIPIAEYDSSTIVGLQFWIEPSLRLYSNIKDTSLVDHAIEAAADSLTTNEFQHVALTYDKASGDAFHYVNGVEITNRNFGTVRPLTTNNLYLGKRFVSSGPGGGVVFNGRIDELSFYNRALSACDIQSIFLMGSQGKCLP